MDHLGFEAGDNGQLPQGFPMPSDVDMSLQPSRSPDEVLRIVLRAVCGFEQVEEVCEREGITPEQFRRWRKLFADACRQLSKEKPPVVAGKSKSGGKIQRLVGVRAEA